MITHMNLFDNINEAFALLWAYIFTPDFKNPYVLSAASMLDIVAPVFLYVPYIAERYSQTSLLLLFDSRIPIDKYMGGHFSPNSKTVLISIRDPYTRHLVPEAFLIYLALHELRHAWQYESHFEEYYANIPSDDQEYIEDPGEVDADAFAMAFMEHETDYSQEQYLPYIANYLRKDNGARVHRKEILVKQYFTNP